MFIVIPKNMAEVEQLLAEFIGDINPDDPRGRRRRQILDAAAELFATRGYRKTSVTEIAERAGVAKGTFYLQFTGKSDVLIAAVALEKSKTVSAFTEQFDPTIPARERLRRWVIGGLIIVARSPLLSRLTGGDDEMGAVLADMSSKVFAESTARTFGTFGDLITAACAPEHLSPDELRERIIAVSTIFYVAPLLRADHVRHGMSLERLAERIGDLVVDGVCSRKEAP